MKPITRIILLFPFFVLILIEIIDSIITNPRETLIVIILLIIVGMALYGSMSK